MTTNTIHYMKWMNLKDKKNDSKQKQEVNRHLEPIRISK